MNCRKRITLPKMFDSFTCEDGLPTYWTYFRRKTLWLTDFRSFAVVCWSGGIFCWTLYGGMAMVATCHSQGSHAHVYFPLNGTVTCKMNITLYWRRLETSNWDNELIRKLFTELTSDFLETRTVSSPADHNAGLRHVCIAFDFQILKLCVLRLNTWWNGLGIN